MWQRSEIGPSTPIFHHSYVAIQVITPSYHPQFSHAHFVCKGADIEHTSDNIIIMLSVLIMPMISKVSYTPKQAIIVAHPYFE